MTRSMLRKACSAALAACSVPECGWRATGQENYTQKRMHTSTQQYHEQVRTAILSQDSNNRNRNKNAEACVSIAIVRGSMLKGQAWRDLQIRGAVC